MQRNIDAYEQIIYTPHFFFTAALTACSSSSDEPENYNPVYNGMLLQGEVVPSAITPLTDGTKNAVLLIDEGAMYKRQEGDGSAWEYVSDTFDGRRSPLTHRLIFIDGRVWDGVPSHKATGEPTAFSLALDAVNRKLYTSYFPMAGDEARFDAVRNTLRIGSVTFTVFAADFEGLTLGFISDYVSADGAGQMLDVAHYRIDAYQIDDGERDLWFESTVDAYDWLIGLFSDTFGEKVNLNTLYSGVVFDDPYFYLSRLVEERDEIMND